MSIENGEFETGDCVIFAEGFQRKIKEHGVITAVYDEDDLIFVDCIRDGEKINKCVSIYQCWFPD